MSLKRRDPGPCPVDDTPHTACCAPNNPPSASGVIIAGPITPALTVTVPTSSPTTDSPVDGTDGHARSRPTTGG